MRRPANHVAMTTYKVALRVLSQFNLIVPSNLFTQNYRLHSFLFCHLSCATDISIDVYYFDFTGLKLNPEKVSIGEAKKSSFTVWLDGR